MNASAITDTEAPKDASLRKGLKRVLPDILARRAPDADNAIKGTALMRLVKRRLSQEYSDATLRYHFSIMSLDPSSPIAKVEHGQGYYLRREPVSMDEYQRTKELAKLALQFRDHYRNGGEFGNPVWHEKQGALCTIADKLEGEK